jgi:CDP-glycerol glycerophosphotransferase
VNSCLAVAVRPFIKRKQNAPKIIIFYGHTLNGNLKAFYDYLLKQEGYTPYFLVLDKHYYRRLKSTTAHPETILDALNVRDMLTVAKAAAFITSHGSHLFSIIRALTDVKFIDVWHGIAYKGFGYEEFDHLRGYDEVWVSSKEVRELYIGRYGFAPRQVKVTGYARTDQLINGTLNKNEIIQKYKIPRADKYILIAPTWQQDVLGRSVLPFDLDAEIFFTNLDALAKKHAAHVIFRTHLNSSEDIDLSNLPNISFMPYSKYEIVEDFLFVADILVTDWSSIAFDYLPLQRPTIFLDVPAPFKHGFSLGPEHRFGDVVGNFVRLQLVIEGYLQHPETFGSVHSRDIQKTIASAYDSTLDGNSSARYFENLKHLLR